MTVYGVSINSAEQLIKAFDEDLPFHDSLIFHFSAQTYNMLFYRSNAPYEVLKSKGFDLISNEELKLKLIDLYSVQYRIIDSFEEEMPQFQSFPYLFEYMKNSFRKSDKQNFDRDWLVSVQPLDYEFVKSDPQYRLLLEHATFWRSKKIGLYKRALKRINEVQELIQKEIN